MGAMNPVLEQEHFRIRDDETAADPGTPNWISTEDQATRVVIDADTLFRVRFVIANTGTANVTSDYSIYYSHESGSYTKAAISGLVQPDDASTPTDADALTTANFQLTPGTGSALDGQYDENNAASNQLKAGDYTELEFCMLIDSAQVTDADTIDLQVYADDAALDVYDFTALIEVNVAAGPDQTADGSPSITPITADGLAERILPADGSPSISAITADGSATREIPSDGSPSISPIESTGVAKQGVAASSGAAYFDGFQRALLGSAYDNGPSVFDELEIIASAYVQAATANDCVALHNVVVGSDQFVEVELLNHNGASIAATQLVARMDGSVIDGYVASLGNDGSGDTYFNIYRVDAGIPALVATSGIIASGYTSYPDGTRLRFECEGTAFRTYIDGALVASDTDAVYANGFLGLGLTAAADQTDAAIERWWFGEVGAGAAISNITSEGAATIVTGGATADGAPSITPITADGEAEVIQTADGSPSITPITSEGEGLPIQTADGSPSINPITADGAAKIIREASGGPSISPITAEGVAEILRTAIGSPSISPITAAGNSFIWPKVYLNTSETLIGATEMTVSSVDIDGTSITFDDSVGPPVGSLFLGVENRVNGDVGWIAVTVTEAVGPTVVFGGFGA